MGCGASSQGRPADEFTAASPEPAPQPESAGYQPGQQRGSVLSDLPVIEKKPRISHSIPQNALFADARDADTGDAGSFNSDKYIAPVVAPVRRSSFSLPSDQKAIELTPDQLPSPLPSSRNSSFKKPPRSPRLSKEPDEASTTEGGASNDQPTVEQPAEPASTPASVPEEAVAAA